MKEHRSSRTLVKSAPELWAECSDAASLARHLGAFGEIRITKLDPETAVAWEGDAASGTVRLEPSGWGTRVILTVSELPREPAAEAPPDDPASGPQPVDAGTEPRPAEDETEQRPVEDRVEPPRLTFDGAWADDAVIRASRLGKLRMRLRRRPELEGETGPEPVATQPMPIVAERALMSPFDDDDEDAAPLALAAALDSLGRAHHRPYSRG